MGLIAGVLLAVAGLFLKGHQQTDSGRNSSTALAVGHAVMEELQGGSFSRPWTLFGDGGAASTLDIDSRSDAAAAAWQAELVRGQLNDPRVEIHLESLVDSGLAPPLAGAQAIRIRVIVFWKEGRRDRKVRLVTVRT